MRLSLRDLLVIWPPKLLCSKPSDLVRYSERERGGSTSQSYAYLFVRSVTKIFNRGLCSRLELSLNGEYCVSPRHHTGWKGGIIVNWWWKKGIVLFCVANKTISKKFIVHTQSSNRLVLFTNWWGLALLICVLSWIKAIQERLPPLIWTSERIKRKSSTGPTWLAGAWYIALCQGVASDRNLATRFPPEGKSSKR